MIEELVLGGRSWVCFDFCIGTVWRSQKGN